MNSIKYILFPLLAWCVLPATLTAQNLQVTLSGTVKDHATQNHLSYVNVVLKNVKDSTFITGTVTGEDGRFLLTASGGGNYLLEISFIGYKKKWLPITTGRLNEFLDLGTIELDEDVTLLGDAVITADGAPREEVSVKMDKKTFDVTENSSQAGGSVLQVMKNLPGVTVDQDGKIQLRGSDKVTILIDGQQTALTGFGNQAGLDNIPASAVERIEIINNPSAKYDANGNAGIINIIFKKSKQEGLNGKAGITMGLGALTRKKNNLPSIRPQYQVTPKINPTLSLNYRKNKINLFFQGDLLWQNALNKNEYTDRIYDTSATVRQQFLENRTQLAFTLKTGFDWFINDRNSFTFSALYNREGHVDRGDLPYFSPDLTQRQRLWIYYEDEVNTSVNASMQYLHRFKQPGHQFKVNLGYTFHREDEKFYFSDTLPSLVRNDTTLLIADENVTDLSVDYVKPLKKGRLELGGKLRWRYIPTEMVFRPGMHSILDMNAQGWAQYNEWVSAIYGNFVFETKHFELEAGVRLEYVNVYYEVNPDHSIYNSNGYDYIQPFPNLRLAYIINPHHRLSFFYNRRVDRPDEYDLRIFPKYDDPEILKTGNPALRPQYTQTFELGYRTNWKSGYFYTAGYFRWTQDMLYRIVTASPNSLFLNSIPQNAGNTYQAGLECVVHQDVVKWFSFNVSVNAYYHIIRAFTIENIYPLNVSFSAPTSHNYSGNVKFNGNFRLPKGFDIQLAIAYLAPDIIPQGRIASRFSTDLGIKKSIQKGKGELFFNATDLFNTLRVKREQAGNGFILLSNDLYETQVIRAGYSYKF